MTYIRLFLLASMLCLVPLVSAYNIDINKTLLTPGNLQVNGSLSFLIKINNTNVVVNATNMTIFDNYVNQSLNFTAANRTPSFVNQSGGEVQWALNITNGTTYYIQVNFSILRNSTEINMVFAENQSSQIDHSANLTYVVVAPPDSHDNYSDLWSQAVYTPEYPQSPYLEFAGAPYVARSDGCYRDPSEANESAAIGYNCCNNQNEGPGDGCDGNGQADYDLGAVWVDEEDDIIGWHILGGFEKISNLSVCDQVNKTVAFVVEFDVDNSQNTGCNNTAGEACYPGADHQIWYFPDVNQSLFATYNTTNEWNVNFEPNLTVSNNGLWIEYNCSANRTGDLRPRGLSIYLNKTLAFGNSNIQLNFETNTFNYTEATTEPIDLLSNFNGQTFTNLFQVNGPGADQGACYLFDNLGETACVNNNQSLNCIWTSFGAGNEGLCDANFSAIDSAGCFGYNDQSTCDADANNIGYCQWQPGSFPLANGSIANGLCIETFKPHEFGGGDCDLSCADCFSQTQCEQSVANGGSEWGGCEWYTDNFNTAGWCDTKGEFSSCAEHPRHCYSDSDCTGAGWSWNGNYSMCLENAGDEVCFNVRDDDGSGQADCADDACAESRQCGGNINTLIGQYQGQSTTDAITTDLTDGLDQILLLKEEFVEDSADHNFEMFGFAIAISNKGLGMGVLVENLTNLTSCGGNFSNVAFVYLADTDANTSSGCNATINGTIHTGFEAAIRYSNFSAFNASGQSTYTHVCYNDEWAYKDSNVVNPPNGDPSTTEGPMECFEEGPGQGMAAVVMVNKLDVGNPTGDMRFTVAMINNTAQNLSNLELIDMIENAYYTPGTVNFDPIDCSQEPTKCGTEYIIVGGGEFMPFEVCFDPGDEDLDGLTNCDDPDCAFAPECSGVSGYNASLDVTAPKLKTQNVDALDDAAYIKFVTSEPTNASLLYYGTDSSCGSATTTLIDVGLEGTEDDYALWHDFALDVNTLGGGLSPSTAYYYKLRFLDQGANLALSSCLNFTTVSTAPNISINFNFSVDNESPFLSNITVVVNGQELNLGEVNNLGTDVQNVNVSFRNKAANSTTNWSITLVGADLSADDTLDFDNIFLGNNSEGENDTIGISTFAWQEMVQKLGADTIELQVPDGFDGLFHCANNGTLCSNVTNETGVRLLAAKSDENVSTWQVPTSLGFSTYQSQGSALSDGSAESGDSGGSSGSSGSSGGGGGGSGGGGGGSIPLGTAKESGSANRFYQTLTPGDNTEFTITNENVAVSKVTFSVAQQATNVDVAVTAFNEKPEEVPAINFDSYQYLSIKGSKLTDEVLGGMTLNFIVSSDFVGSDDPTTVALFHYVDDQWKTEPTTYLGEFDGEHGYESSFDSLSFFAIGKTAPSTQSEPVAAEDAAVDTAITGAAVDDTAGEPEPKDARVIEFAQKDRPTVWIWWILAIALVVGFIYWDVKLLKAKKERLAKKTTKKKEK